ncbi:MAG: NAD(P)/FAD-dependent oxidoreductase [Myxococcota bacterium]
MSVSIWQDRSGEMLREVDVAIIGAGLVGCAIALEASRHARTVAILEGRTLGSGGTGRGPGLFLPALPEGYGQTVHRFGRQTARELLDSALETRAMLEATSRRHRLNFETRGVCLLGVTAQQADTLAQSATLLTEDGVPARYEAEATGTRGFRGSLHFPQGMALDPLRLTEALRQESNALLYEGCEVFGVIPESDHISLLARRGTFRARKVFLATDAYTPVLIPDLERRLHPVRTEMLLTHPLDWRLEMPAYADEGKYSVRQLLNGRMMLGCGGPDFGDGDQTWVEQTFGEAQQALDVFAQRYFPEVVGHVVRRWSGTLGMTVDGLPLVGQLASDPRVCYAVGFGDFGLNVGLSAARRVVSLAYAGEDPGLFSATRLH